MHPAARPAHGSLPARSRHVMRPSRDPAARVVPAPSGWHRRLVLAGPLLFTGIVMLQMFHFMEHIVQVVQKYGLGYTEAHGVIGQVVDREVVHFAYNTSLYLGLLAVLVAFGVRARWRDGRRPWMTLLVAAAAVQTYHVGEHWVKFFQYFSMRHDDTPGILGQFVPVIAAHFVINLLVFAPLLVAWVQWRRARLEGAVDRPLAVALRIGARPWGPRPAPAPAPVGACLPLAQVRSISVERTRPAPPQPVVPTRASR